MELQQKKYLITGMTPNAGGIEAFIMNFLRYSDRKKLHFDFIVNFEETIAFEEELLDYGCSIYRLPGRKKHPIFHYIQYFRFFKTHAKVYDGIYCNLLSLTNIDDMRFAYKNRIPNIIAHAHNNNDVENPCLGIRPFLHKLHKKRVIKSSTLLLSCSESAGKWMFGKDTSFQVINNAIDLGKFVFSELDRNIIRRKNNIDPSTLVLGSVGRLETQKNPLFLIDIFYHVKQICHDSMFLHIGNGSFYDEMKKKIARYHLQDSYILLGSLEDTSPFYSAMDVFLFPSLYEGLGISLIEAQANDVVCFISDTIPEEAILIENKCFSFPLSMPAVDWAKKILQQEDLIKKERRDNFTLISDKGYDVKTEIKKLERIICNEKNKANYT